MAPVRSKVHLDSPRGAKVVLCTLLISVDRDLLDMKQINEIPIIRPGEFWRTADVS
jgi:hypothetical protein